MTTESLRTRIAVLENKMMWEACDRCGGLKLREADDCDDCLRKYGPALFKAMNDVWPFWVQLDSYDQPFVASTCDLYGDWVNFHDKDDYRKDLQPRAARDSVLHQALDGRGLCVALSRIVWINDTDS